MSALAVVREIEEKTANGVGMDLSDGLMKIFNVTNHENTLTNQAL
jgi:hypothetical protein